VNIWLLKIGELLPFEAGARKLRTRHLADKLTERGHTILWWTSAFDHFRKKWIFNKDTDIQINERFKLKALRGIGYKRNISLRRFIDHRIIALKFRRIAFRVPKPDIIITAIPSYDLAFEAVSFANKKGTPVLVDIRDQWPDIFIENIPSKLRKIGRFFLRGEFSMLQNSLKMANGLISMSNVLLQWGLSYVGREKTWRDKVFYLGYTKGFVNSDSNSNKIHNLKNTLKDKFIVIFVGTFAKYHNPSIILDCAKLLAEDNIGFVLAGDGELFQKLKNRAASLKNVFFPGWLNQDEIGTLLKYSHVGICPTGQIGKNFFFPNKAFAYFSEGLPILSSFEGEIKDILDEFKVGYTYNDVESLVRCIRALSSNIELCMEMKANAMKLFNDRFDANKIYVNYAEHIEKVFQSFHQALPALENLSL